MFTLSYSAYLVHDWKDDACGAIPEPPTRLPKTVRRGPKRKGKYRRIAAGFDPAPCPFRFDTIRIRLPWAPSVNHAWRSGNGVVYKSKGYKDWEEEAGDCIIEQRIPRSSLAHPMSITITQHAKTKRGDVDNGAKTVIDLLRKTGVIYDDHREIVKRVVMQDGYRSKEPWVEVEIECLT